MSVICNVGVCSPDNPNSLPWVCRSSDALCKRLRYRRHLSTLWAPFVANGSICRVIRCHIASKRSPVTSFRSLHRRVASAVRDITLTTSPSTYCINCLWAVPSSLQSFFQKRTISPILVRLTLHTSAPNGVYQILLPSPQCLSFCLHCSHLSWCWTFLF